MTKTLSSELSLLTKKRKLRKIYVLNSWFFLEAVLEVYELVSDAVKSHFKALGLYNFIRGFGWAYKRGGLYPGGLTSGIKKCYRTTRYNVSEKRIKANITLHFELHL